MASRRRSPTAKAQPTHTAHLTSKDHKSPSICHTHPDSDDGYKAVSDVLSLYGINGDGLAESFHSNKTQFAAAVVDKFYKRDRKQGLLPDYEVLQLVDIRHLKAHNAERHINQSSCITLSDGTTQVPEDADVIRMQPTASTDCDEFEFSDAATIGETIQVISPVNDGAEHDSSPKEATSAAQDRNGIAHATLETECSDRTNKESDVGAKESYRQLGHVEQIESFDLEEATSDVERHDDVTIVHDEEIENQRWSCDSEPYETELLQHADDNSFKQRQTELAEAESMQSESPASKNATICGVDGGEDENPSVQKPLDDNQGGNNNAEIMQQCSMICDVADEDEEVSGKMMDVDIDNGCNPSMQLETPNNDMREIIPHYDSVADIICSMKECKSAAMEDDSVVFTPLDTMGSTLPTSRLDDDDDDGNSTIGTTSIESGEIGTGSEQECQMESSTLSNKAEFDDAECQKTGHNKVTEDLTYITVENTNMDIQDNIIGNSDVEGDHSALETQGNVVQDALPHDEYLSDIQRKESVTPEENCSPELDRFHSIQGDSQESNTFHDVVSARSCDGDALISMISSVEFFRQNIHRVTKLLCSMDRQQLESVKPLVDKYMRTAAQDNDGNTEQLTFVLLIFLEITPKDPIKLSHFMQLVIRVTSKVTSSEIDQEYVYIYRLFLQSVRHLMVNDLSFEVARTLMDAFVGLAFKIQKDTHPLFNQLRTVLLKMVNRCSAVDEYQAVINMLNLRIAAGENHSKLIRTLILRLIELLLSSAAIDNPFHEVGNAVQQLVKTAFNSNFSFLKALVDSLIKTRHEFSAHFIILFIARLMMGYYRDDSVTMVQKRRCLRLLQTIALPVFEILDDVEKACGFMQEYVACFPVVTASIFKLALFDLSLLEGCGKTETPRGRQPFDEDSLREAAYRYMRHLGCNALQNGKLCDLVLLLSIKHVARVSAPAGRFSKTDQKRRLQRQQLFDDCSNAECGDKFSDTKKHKTDDSAYASVGSSASPNTSNRPSVVPMLQLKNVEYVSDAASNSSGKLNTLSDNNGSVHVDDSGNREGSMDGHSQSGALERLLYMDAEMDCIHQEENGPDGTLTDDLDNDHVVRYAKIVCRLFSATRGKRSDATLQPEIAQYLLMPAQTLSHVEDVCDAETCYKVLLYHIYNEIFLSIWRNMTNVLYSSNDYSQLSSASTFLYSVVVKRFEYLQYRVVRKLVIACMGDQCCMVRLAAVKLFSELFERSTNFEDWISDAIMDKLRLAMRDVNWKVRLVATTAIYHYLRKCGINLNVMQTVAAVAERACDIEKEQQRVRDAVLKTLAFSLFSTSHPFLSPAGNMDTRILALTDRFVKVILYKMSAFKARDNQVNRVLQYFKENFAEVEGKEESTFMQSLSKNELKDMVENHTKNTLEKWMNLLLDLFLQRRSEGATFHVLAEVLCVLKLFGQANPKLFASHLTYFIPYLKVDAEDTFDTSRIDVMVLVCNLVAIASGHSKDLQEIDHHVVQLVSFDAPALTRAAMQLLVELGSLQHIATICEEAIDYLSNLRSIIEKERNSPEAIVKVMSYNVLLRSAWKVGCAAEFADLTLVFPTQPNWPQQLFDLILSMANIFYNARLYNIAGMLVQAIARIFVNIHNLIRIDFKGVKSVVIMFGDAPMVMCVMMLLYQLLATYAKLAGPVQSDNSTTPVAKFRSTQNDVFCCLGSFIEAFVQLVTMDGGANSAIQRCADVDLVMTLEVCNMILNNRLTNPEPMAAFIFCHIVSSHANVQRLAEQALKTLVRNDPDIFMAKLGSCLQSLFLSVVIDSFTDSLPITQKLERAEGKPQCRKAASNAKHSLTDVASAVHHGASQNSRLYPGQGFILGYEAEFTAARVRGIVRLFLEAITSVKYCKKLVSIVIAQLSACMTRDFREAMTLAIEQRNIQTEELRHIKSSNNARLSRMLMKQVARARNGDPEGLVDYFTLLFIDMIATVIDHLTFRDAKVARFLVKRAAEVMKSCDEVAADTLWKYRDSRLATLSAKIKQFYT